MTVIIGHYRAACHAADMTIALRRPYRLMTGQARKRIHAHDLRKWPAQERPREKLMAQGVQTLSDAELLALLLGGSGIRGGNASIWRASLLAAHRSLRELLSPTGRPCCSQGRGWARPATAACRPRSSWRGATMPRPCATVRRSIRRPTTRRFLSARLRDQPHELFCCLHLDNRHRLIAFDELFRGTIDGASVHPREVVKQALARNAAAVILAHNHPSGVAEPSQADELITRRLREALALVDIRVLDHCIVADTGCLSFAERGLL